ncbi:hypothetical protein CGLO_05618 [Colletotrichum gloeosporioides Cg-14]|uniref:Uncharacterized protein n=1 Tax=Colletotrichum gloeosporioides (strain Cg-14) TaxID=1237896 RepID=T0KPT5_COLGC|nr:hypothetical protein CGLO_05618 [Colletotrichum gloeosporioides Cg-14]
MPASRFPVVTVNGEHQARFAVVLLLSRLLQWLCNGRYGTLSLLGPEGWVADDRLLLMSLPTIRMLPFAFSAPGPWHQASTGADGADAAAAHIEELPPPMQG